MTAQYVQFGRSRIHYSIVRNQSRKHTEIVVLGPSKVKVLAPKGKSTADIRNLVKSNSRWIFKKRLRINEYQDIRLSYVVGSTLPYLGKNHRIHDISFKGAAKERENIFLYSNGRFVVRGLHVKPRLMKSLYENWLTERAEDVIRPRINRYAGLLRLNPKALRVRIKSQRNRLGSLGRNLVLNFNKNLLRLSPDVIDYVIVHELCHVKIPDHSAKYWLLVSSILPDYEYTKIRLRKYTPMLLS